MKALQKLNDKRKRNALAEKILLAMMTNGEWWCMYSKDKKEVMRKCFEWADSFIKESEVNNE